MKYTEATESIGAAFLELLTGKAHRVHPADATRSLGERLAGEALLLVVLAKEKAATVRVRFDAAGTPVVGETRQVANRNQGELARVLQAEARTTGARWGLAVFALGWQAVLGIRSSRPGQEGSAFDRFRLPLEQPELFCAHPQSDALFTCVDHPTLDRSVVFSVKRRDVEEVLQDFRSSGLGVAAIRIGVAAQLEAWFASGPGSPLENDLLVSDSLSALLLQVDNGDFRAPTGTISGADARPRQAAARPGETASDINRFLRDQAHGRVGLLGDTALIASVLANLQDTQLQLERTPEGPWHDSVSAVLAAGVLHDLNPDLREERAPLSLGWRKTVWVGMVTALAFLLLTGVNCWQVCSAQWQRQEAEEEASIQRARTERVEKALSGIDAERARAQRLRQWILHNYHAQPLAHELLKKMPSGVGLERLSAHLEEGSAQMTLEFVLNGEEAAQAAATRALERGVIERSLQIGERHPVVQAARGTLHRWRLLLPSGEGEEGGGSRGTATARGALWASESRGTGGSTR